MRKILSGRRGSGRGPFQMIVNTAITTQYGSQPPSGTNQFYFPIAASTDTQGYSINFDIDWGDGTTSSINSTNFATACLHTYASPGTYTISAEGNIAAFNFWNSATNGKSDGNKLLEITRWGDLKMTGGATGTAGQIFRQCGKLTTISAPDTPWFTPDTFGLTNTRGGRATFANCTNLVIINNIANWDVSNLSSTEIMFQSCTKFQFGTNANGPIDLSSWDVSRVIRFERMFFNAQSFNGTMFSNVGANTTSTNIDMEKMFSFADSFDNNFSQTMNSWDTSGVSNMKEMFNNATIFNDKITSWDTSNVTTMRSMFSGANAFNQSIGGWNTGNVVDMRNMFTDASNFDKDISGWNVNAWNVSTVGSSPMTGPTGTFNLSTSNYDALLLAWDNNYSFPSWPGGTVDFGSSQYSLTSPGNSVANARASLVTKWGTLNDGGGV